MLLGAGRARMDSPIDPAVGVVLHKKTGEAVSIDEPLCTVFVNDESCLKEALDKIKGAFQIGPKPVAVPPLVVERICSYPEGSRFRPVAVTSLVNKPARN